MFMYVAEGIPITLTRSISNYLFCNLQPFESLAIRRENRHCHPGRSRLRLPQALLRHFSIACCIGKPANSGSRIDLD
jgi:hypothetical protein